MFGLSIVFGRPLLGCVGFRFVLWFVSGRVGWLCFVVRVLRRDWSGIGRGIGIIREGVPDYVSQDNQDQQHDRRADGTEDRIQLRHSLNDEQVEWFKAGSALNLLRAKN